MREAFGADSENILVSDHRHFCMHIGSEYHEIATESSIEDVQGSSQPQLRSGRRSGVSASHA